MRRLLPLPSLICLLWFVLPNSPLYATHDMGMEIHYECLSGCTVRVWFEGYLDCAGSNTWVPTVNPIGIGSNCTAPTPIQSSWSTFTNTDISPVCPGQATGCPGSVAGNPVAGVQEIKSYRDFAFCNLNCTQYKLVWTTCCRSNFPTNLTNPGTHGLFSDQTIVDLSLTPCNSSPEFLGNFIYFLPREDTLQYTFAATDRDGDSLVYRLGDCYTGAGNNTGQVVNYAPGVTSQQPFGSDFAFEIDSLTGNLHWAPLVANPSHWAAYVCVYVDEYRNGVKIGSIMRDMELIVIPSLNNRYPKISDVQNLTAGTVNGSVIEVCSGQQLCFDLPVTDGDPNDTHLLTWDQNIPGATFSDASNSAVQDSITGNTPTGHFCWTPTQPGEYSFTVFTDDSYCPVPGKAARTFRIRVTNGQAGALPSVLSQRQGCADVALSALPSNPGAYQYTWTGGGGLSANTQAGDSSLTHTFPGPGTYHYAIAVLDSSGCAANAFGTVSIPDARVTTAAALDSCLTVAYAASASTWAPDSSLSWSWSGDQNLAGGLPSFNHSYLAAGHYAWSVMVSDAAGCVRTITDSILVPGPPMPFIQQNGVQLMAMDTTASGMLSYQWNLDGQAITGATQDSLTATQSGAYTVTVRDALGCETTSNATQVVITASNVPEPSAIQLWPQPAMGYLMIQATVAATQPASLSLLDMQGRRLSGAVTTPAQLKSGYRMALETIPAGIYFLEIRSGDHRAIRKVSIQ